MNIFKKFKNLVESLSNEIYVDNEGGEAVGYATETSSEKVDNWINQRHKLNNNDFVKYLRDNYETIAFLNNMNVDESLRGQGHGSDLLDQFIEKAGNELAEAIVLFADTQEEQEEGFYLVSFYESYDFEIVKAYPDGVLMILEF